MTTIEKETENRPLSPDMDRRKMQMNENAEKFLEALLADKELESALKEALEGIEPGKQAEAIVKFAREKGFDFSEADLNPNEQELSLDELENVAGGGCNCMNAGGGCACLAAGGGGGTDLYNDKTFGCACVAYGQGGDGSADDKNCLCVFAGAGDYGTDL